MTGIFDALSRQIGSDFFKNFVGSTFNSGLLGCLGGVLIGKIIANFFTHGAVITQIKRSAFACFEGIKWFNSLIHSQSQNGHAFTLAPIHAGIDLILPVSRLPGGSAIGTGSCARADVLIAKDFCMLLRVK